MLEKKELAEKGRELWTLQLWTLSEFSFFLEHAKKVKDVTRLGLLDQMEEHKWRKQRDDLQKKKVRVQPNRREVLDEIPTRSPVLPGSRRNEVLGGKMETGRREEKGENRPTGNSCEPQCNRESSAASCPKAEETKHKQQVHEMLLSEKTQVNILHQSRQKLVIPYNHPELGRAQSRLPS